ncbi:hypothetical protein MferCBS31731_006651 [Microsporum ferrugineum]
MAGSEQLSSPLGFGSVSGSGSGPRLSISPLFNANTSSTPGAPANAPTNASHTNSRSSRFASVKRYLRTELSRSRSKSKTRNEIGATTDEINASNSCSESENRAATEARYRSSTVPSSHNNNPPQSWFCADSSPKSEEHQRQRSSPLIDNSRHSSLPPPTPPLHRQTDHPIFTLPLPPPRPRGSSLSRPQQLASGIDIPLPLSPPLSPTTLGPSEPSPSASTYGRSQEYIHAPPPPPPNVLYPSTSILSRLSETPDIAMASTRRPSSSRGGDTAGNPNTITGSSLPIHTHSHSNSQSQSQPQPQSQSQSQSQPQSQTHTQTQNATTLTAGPTNLSGLVCNVHRTTGREPHALVGATTTILGDKLYVFGGRLLSRARPELTSDLYELDLIKRHWTKIHPTGDVPPPRYFHSMCPLGDTKLVCYGGMSPRSAVTGHPPTNISSSQSAVQDAQPEVVVMSDVHIYDVVTRTWTHINTANTPQGRYAHCATILPSSAPFVSANAPMTAIHNNPSTSNSNPHQGSIGVEIDGYGGAEMVVVGGQDSSNHYIEQISVFNLRSLKWTATSPLGRSCGAYRSVVVPLTGMSVNDLGAERTEKDLGNVVNNYDGGVPGSSMLIYSNYNFLDVKLELQARLPDGKLVEKAMDTSVSPPGLRFPNGGVINGHFVVSGTYLTASKQEYALWALDLKTMTWGRIDAGGSIFSSGSWNRGIIWNRRSTFVILGHRKRNLVEDYNHRRINFSHICMVELEAFGLYENPRRAAPTSGYISVSAPALRPSLQAKFSVQCSGGRPYSAAAEKLGLMAQACTELADMDLLTIGGERIPVSSHILSRRWGPYFVQLLCEATAVAGDSINDAATLRQPNAALNSRNSTITITPSLSTASQYSTATTLVNTMSNNNNNSSLGGTNNSNNNANSHKDHSGRPPGSSSSSSSCLSRASNLEIPSAHNLSPAVRPRTLYLPHTFLTVQLLVHYLYTSSLPPVGSALCTPQILCSLLQLARPYQVDGLLEATVERLHQVLDGRNAAAVFNAAAMAAGGGRGTNPSGTFDGTMDSVSDAHAHSYGRSHSRSQSSTADYRRPSNATDGISSFNSSDAESIDRPNTASSTASASSVTAGRGVQRPANLRINTSFGNGRNRAESDSASIPNSASTNNSNGGLGFTDAELAQQSQRGRNKTGRDVWTADISSVVGLQKRGLRGLMEGRRMRERGASSADTQDQSTSGVIPVKMGLGIS